MVVEKLAKVRGRGQWRMWTPEARLRAGFATASLKETASQFAEGAGDAAGRGRAPSSVHYNKNLVASVIEDGTTRGVTRLQERSLEDPLAFWITTSMFDETKLWYRLRRGGIRNWSTLAWHTVVTWRGSHGGVRDEDIVRAPACMKDYTARNQWRVLTRDPIAGLRPTSAPVARFYGVNTSCDSHPVNKMALNRLRYELPPTTLMLVALCIQHKTGDAAADVSTALRIFTESWLAANTFAQGDFFSSLRDHVLAILHDDDKGLEVADPATWVPDPGDLDRSFTDTITELTCNAEPSADAEANAERRNAVKAFAAFFPVGWNRSLPGGRGRAWVGARAGLRSSIRLRQAASGEEAD